MEKFVTELNGHLKSIISDVPGSKGANAKQKTVNEYKAVISDLKKQRAIIDREDKAAQEIIKEARAHLQDFEKIGQMEIPATPIKDKKEKLKDAVSKLGELLSKSGSLAKALQ